ncbi:hypothetical protein ID866_12836 [Astraeus odoratus]|nr:hypothetical protein ID866_12836 [Astraeus odoratus]
MHHSLLLIRAQLSCPLCRLSFQAGKPSIFHPPLLYLHSPPVSTVTPRKLNSLASPSSDGHFKA